MAHEYRGGELLALLLLEEDVVSSVRHRTQLTSLFACPLQDSSNRVEALYGNYAPKRAGIGIRSHLKLQPGDVLTARRRCARGDFGRYNVIPNLPFWTCVMHADGVFPFEKRRHWLSKSPAQLLG